MEFSKYKPGLLEGIVSEVDPLFGNKAKVWTLSRGNIKW